jgi:hypothetical protein
MWVDRQTGRQRASARARERESGEGGREGGREGGGREGGREGGKERESRATIIAGMLRTFIWHKTPEKDINMAILDARERH